MFVTFVDADRPNDDRGLDDGLLQAVVRENGLIAQTAWPDGKRGMTQASLGRLHYDGRGLPRGRSSLAPLEVGAAHRDRLTHAVIGVVARRGYAATTVADVVAAARVSRAAFYGQFGSKEECFLDACFQGLGLMARAVGEAQAQAPADPPEAVLRATVTGFLRFCVEEEAFARCFLLEMPLAGDEALRRYLAVIDMLADNTRRWHEGVVANGDGGPLRDPGVYRMLSSGGAQEAAARLRADDAASLPGLTDDIVQIHVTALLGRDPP
jgi:AcrR family transcriptional regulator